MIYGHEGEGDRRTENETHGKSGYHLVIVQTDTEEFKKLQKKKKKNG